MLSLTKSFSILFLFVMLASCSFAQKGEDVPSDAEPPFKIPKAGAFIDSLKPKDSVKRFNLSSANGFADICEDTPKIFHDTVFNKHDIVFLKKQIMDNRTREWMPADSVWGATIITKAEIQSFSVKGPIVGWDKFHKKYGKGYYLYSFPIFSVDGTKAVMLKGFHDSGDNNPCSIDLYEKIKGKWKAVKAYSSWKE